MRQQTSGLQSQLQQVQLERSTLQSRLKTSQAEIDSLQQVRQWYQQQLALAQEARVRLQSEMATMQVRLMFYGVVFFLNQGKTFCRHGTSVFPLSQAGQMTQIGVVEHLKLENVTLSHQLTETQHRSIKDKERIAVQLQSIEVHSQPTIVDIGIPCLITGWNTDVPSRWVKNIFFSKLQYSEVCLMTV